MKLSSAIAVLFAAIAAGSAAAADAQCLGDCNRNGVVTADEIVFGTNILFDASLLAQCDSFDADGDNDSDAADFVLWRKQYGAVQGAGSGATAPGQTAVPEPSVILLLSAALLLSWGSRVGRPCF